MISLRSLTSAAGGCAVRRLCSADADVSLEATISTAWLDTPVARLRGRSILIATDEQFATACALIACDGIARRMVICPPGIPDEHLAALAAAAEVDVVLCDDAARSPLRGVEAFAVLPHHVALAQASDGPRSVQTGNGQANPTTEWILPTSGTSGAPKLVSHTLQTLIGAMTSGNLGIGSVWSTFYDIRRYGGLQIFLRAMIGGGSMILSSGTEPTTAFLVRAVRHGVTHITGTTWHWRRALMSPACPGFAPRYVRLSGEIADQAILDRLHTTFPEAAISHAFASTEAGVAFEVVDGLAGFPAKLVGGDSSSESVGGAGAVAIRIVDGSLRIKSNRTGMCYLGELALAIFDADGFVDTGDMVELHKDRYFYVGRRSGIINVGGLKIHPEEVEAVISDHPRVRMCVVSARKNPITGAIVAADVVADEVPADAQAARALKDEITALCRLRLARHKVPFSISLVSTLDIAGSGKMRR